MEVKTTGRSSRMMICKDAISHPSPVLLLLPAMLRHLLQRRLFLILHRRRRLPPQHLLLPRPRARLQLLFRLCHLAQVDLQFLAPNHSRRLIAWACCPHRLVLQSPACHYRARFRVRLNQVLLARRLHRLVLLSPACRCRARFQVWLKRLLLARSLTFSAVSCCLRWNYRHRQL